MESGNMDTGSATPAAAQTTDVRNTINLEGGKSLLIAGSDLVLRGANSTTSGSKGSRACLPGPKGNGDTDSIPLYNVLWAECIDTTLTIDYADRPKPTSVRAAKWTLVVSNNSLPDIPQWIDDLLGRAYGQAKMKKRAKVILNPHAGPGGAVKKWRNDVEPLFRAARMPMDVVTTTYSGEAVGIASEIDIDSFDTIVACSGDGLPHEVFNGLGKRPDARRALSKIAVSHIPCGSGNAMSCNLYGTHRPDFAGLAIIKGVNTAVDLVSITQGETRTLSFLSQSLGMVAESDLATEHLRWMGGARFTYGFITRVCKKQTYPCDIAVKVEYDDKTHVKAHYKRSRTNSEAILARGAETGSTVPPQQDGADVRTEATSESSSSMAGGSEEGLPPLRYGTVNDKLPVGWELVPHEKLGNFYCGTLAYMAPDANFFSAAWMNDGLMDLVCTDGDLPVLKSVNMLLGVSDGSFFDNPHVSYKKVSAYRIVPRQQDGYISIDGERVPFKPFQAEVHQGLGVVISKRGVMEAPGPKGWDRVTLADRIMA